jgi:hypothetical protein
LRRISRGNVKQPDEATRHVRHAQRYAHLPPEAQRALAEAEERRKKAKTVDLPTELGGRDGPEPVRYGDWEKKGLAIDF